MSSTVIEKIEKKLREAFAPTFLKVIDESYLHADHYSSRSHPHKLLREREETHFHVIIVSRYFLTLSKVERHRAVYQILRDELKETIHALAINAQSTEE